MPHPSKLKLSIAFWITKNKIIFKRLAIFLAFLISLLYISYAAYSFVDYYSSQAELDSLISGINKNYINFEMYRIKLKPVPLKTRSVDILKGSEDKYDYVALVANQNDRWYIEKITYKFTDNGYSTNIFEDFILPNQSKYLVAYNQEPTTYPRALDLNIIDAKHVRVRRLLDVDLSDFVIEESEYIPALASPLGTPRIRFSVANNSLYNFWEVPFKIIIYDRSLPVGVNVAYVIKFKSGETKTVEIAWPEKISYHITNVLVVPDINLFDESNYMPVEAETAEL